MTLTTLSTITSIIHVFIKKFDKEMDNTGKFRELNCKDETINHPNIYYFVYSGARKVFHKIMQHIFFKAWFPSWFNIR